MNKTALLLMVLGLSYGMAIAQKATKTENIFLITVDGLRWQEFFKGADSLFVDDTGMIKDQGSLLPEFWHQDPLKRRQMLMPFTWSTLAEKGQLYGNRAFGNKADLRNDMLFSYPGYNEILTGAPDDERINSNAKTNNPNTTLLEHLQQMPEFEGKVMAFGSWDVFPYIINEERSGIPVNAGFDKAEGANLSPAEQMINRMQAEIRGPWGGVRLDPFTHHYAMEAIRKQAPRLVFIGYGEPDDWAHGNRYDEYLHSIKQFDSYLKELWEYIQTTPQYKDKTTMIITTDHGRGVEKRTWTGHGAGIPRSREVWIAAIGPDSPALGEVKQEAQVYTAMIARTVFQLLGLSYPEEKADDAIASILP
ncbi:phosphoglycerate mutase [Cyclobacterium lianum]|uniref:Phosphoglycerate mutase n=1 Tax=Cyclobacterium lianum TaxID=388280 RepID=A0A1M7HS98_9BACT|nr:alkaline phosphatase family protein [Cyclobacterium lianum]SHM30997.1 phosphoglycerate mutase [Cyclobacterium lianum]